MNKLKNVFVRIGDLFKKVFKKIKEKWFSILLYLLAIFLSFCAFFNSCSLKNNNKPTLQASADEITSLDYASLGYNLLPKIQDSFDFSIYGGLFTFNNDGSILLNGTVDTGIWNSNIYEFTDLPAGKYYCTSTAPFLFKPSNGATAGTFTLEENNNIIMSLYVPAGTYDNLLVKPFLIKSDSFPTYSAPYYIVQDSSYTNGYDDGYNVGYNQGYQDGYDRGLDIGKNVYHYGFGYDATLNVELHIDFQDEPVFYTAPFDYQNGGLTFIIELINSLYPNKTFNICYVTIDFDVLIPVSKFDIEMRTLNREMLSQFAISYKDTSTNTQRNLNVSFENTGFALYQSNNNFGTRNFIVDSFSFYIRPDIKELFIETLNSTRFVFLDPFYDTIYNDGFNAGYNESQNTISSQLQNQYDSGYNTGLTQGFNEGYSKGKIEGYNQGREVSDSDYGFLGLIDSIGYGITKPFVSILNFDLLGVNMLSFVTAIITLFLIIKLVGLFV